MQLLINVFTKFIFEKLLLHEELVTGRQLLATTCMNNQTRICKEL